MGAGSNSITECLEGIFACLQVQQVYWSPNISDEDLWKMYGEHIPDGDA